MISTSDTIPTIYLKPGEQYFAIKPAIISTVLGSCVSITMHSPEHGKSGICHAVLPEEVIPGEPFRYVDSSIAAMLRQFDRHGIRKNVLEVKLFGGADILAPSEYGLREMTVGKQNILRAKQIINREQLNLLTYDIGGTRGRKIIFHTHSGVIYLKRLREVTR
ncbi:MAG: chemotaxis protein CheD [Geobacteraceae bacterium]